MQAVGVNYWVCSQKANQSLPWLALSPPKRVPVPKLPIT